MIEPALLALVGLYFVNRKLEDGARKLDKLFKDYLEMVPDLKVATPESERIFESNKAYQQFALEATQLGCLKIGGQIEHHKDVVALHTVWWNEAAKAYHVALIRHVQPEILVRVVQAMNDRGQLFMALNSKGMQVTIPGKFQIVLCEKASPLAEVRRQFEDRSGYDPGSCSAAGSMQGFLALREQSKRIRREYLEETRGIIPIELLRQLASRKMDFTIRILHAKIRRLNRSQNVDRLRG